MDLVGYLQIRYCCRYCRAFLAPKEKHRINGSHNGLISLPENLLPQQKYLLSSFVTTIRMGKNGVKAFSFCDVLNRSPKRNSILPVASKVFKRILYKQLVEYLDAENLLSEYQFGFRCSHSTVSVLLDCSNEWYCNMDRGLYNLVIFLDLQKAFIR